MKIKPIKMLKECKGVEEDISETRRARRRKILLVNVIMVIIMVFGAICTIKIRYYSCWILHVHPRAN